MKKHCQLIFLAAAGITLTLASALAAPAISLEQYLGEVTEKNPGLRASNASAKGFAGVSDSAAVLTAPYAFGNYVNFDDRKETNTPAFQGNRTQVKQYTVGLGMNTPIGLNAKYSFNSANTQIYGANTAQLPVPIFYTSYNQLELKQSILKNGFGSETRAQRDALATKNQGDSYAAQYSALAQIVQAENTYWRLAFARRSVEMQQDVLARAQRNLDWAKRRVNMQLGDKSDLLQAQANHDLRRLELGQAQEEERNASRAFNMLRYEEGNVVAETVNLPSLEDTLKSAAGQKEGVRLDIKAAEQYSLATAASAQLDAERVKPTLDLYATLAWNGKDSARPAAVKEAFRSDHSANTVGVTLSIPLAVGAMAKGIRGSRLVQENAELTLEQQRLKEGLEWNELESKFAEARSRLALLRTIENVQKEKYENERQRLMRGRTTTYQALAFEQDYANTQLSSLRTHSEVLQLRAQMKLYRGEQ